MKHWTAITRALARLGYELAGEYQALGDCPPNIKRAVGGAAEARHEVTEDDGLPTPKQAAEQIVAVVGQALATQGRLPDELPIRLADLGPPIRVYRRIPPVGQLYRLSAAAAHIERDDKAMSRAIKSGTLKAHHTADGLPLVTLEEAERWASEAKRGRPRRADSLGRGCG